MIIPEALRLHLLGYAQGVMSSRKPDLLINDNYVERWMVYPKNRWGNIYIHRFNGDDTDRALHDHEPDNMSVLLQNDYYEHFHCKPLTPTLMPDGSRRYQTYSMFRSQGQVICRLAGTPHRISLYDQKRPVITMFVQGFRRRKWGFWCTSGWVPWDVYINKDKGYGDRSGGCPS